MRIVHICSVAPPQGGGMGAVAYQEVKRLRALGMDATLVAPNTTFNIQHSTNEDGVSHLPAYRIGNVGRLMGLDLIVKDADVVHLHYPYYFTAGRLAALRRQGKIKKLVMTLHMDATDKGWRWLAAEGHRRLFQKRVLDAADLLLVSTLDYARHSSFAPWVEDPRLHELPFGVDTETYRPSSLVPSPSSFGIPEGAKVVGTVSVMDRAHPFKGIDVLLRAAAILSPDVHVLLVGDGDRRKNYEQMAKELGFGERVHFTGRLEQSDLVKALQSMDVFAFPSTSRAEAFGLAMLEAMACGIPVVASDLPGVRAVAQGAGLIVPVNEPVALAESLRRLLDDSTSRMNFSKAALSKATQYSWDNHTRVLLAHYQNLCA
jgi:glycosyltransferase involved in cell wall biosynthesis